MSARTHGRVPTPAGTSSSTASGGSPMWTGLVNHHRGRVASPNRRRVVLWLPRPPSAISTGPCGCLCPLVRPWVLAVKSVAGQTGGSRRTGQAAAASNAGTLRSRGERAFSAPEPPRAELVDLVARKTASFGDREAWAAILVAAGGYGVRNRDQRAFRDAVWLARKAGEAQKRLARAAGKVAAREKSWAKLRRRRGAAAAAVSKAADVLGAFPVEMGSCEKGTP